MTRRTIWQSGLLACVLTWGLTGCGTWMHSDLQSVQIYSIPPESQVVVDNYLHLIAPGTVTLSRKTDHTAQVMKDGYTPVSFRIERTWSWWIIGDVFGCLIILSPFCIMHDVNEGGYYTFDDQVYVTLQRSTAPQPPPAP